MTIPAGMLQDMANSRPTGEAWLWLCEFAVPTVDTQYLAKNNVAVTYAGQEYDKFNFNVGRQPFSGGGTIPRVTLQLSNINRRIEQIVNQTQGAIGGTVKLIRVNSNYLTNPITALEYDYSILSAETDNEWATFVLGIPNPLTQRFPLDSFNSKRCPYATPSRFKGPQCGYDGVDTSCTGYIEDCRTKGNAARWGGELGLDPSVAG